MITEMSAAEILPSGEALERAEQKIAALQSIRYFERRLEMLGKFYHEEAARLQSKIDEGRVAYARVSTRARAAA